MTILSLKKISHSNLDLCTQALKMGGGYFGNKTVDVKFLFQRISLDVLITYRLINKNTEEKMKTRKLIYSVTIDLYSCSTGKR